MSNGFHRGDLQNGDLLIWRKANFSNKSSNYLKLVRLLTSSDFGHVSTVWRKDGEPFHVEAVMPKIRHSFIPLFDELYVIPLNLNASDEVMREFFQDKIGLDYSFFDAICGLLGWTLKDKNRYQCAELKNEFLRYMGLDVGKAYTPNNLVMAVLEQTGLPLLKLAQ